MDVSGETADILIKEGVQAAEGAVKLAGTGIKNIAALLAALAKQNHKVVGRTSSKRLARDPAPAEVIQIKKTDIKKFRKLAKKYGILYFMVHKRGNKSGFTNVVSTANYAAQLNALLSELGYAAPQKAPEAAPEKKQATRPQSDRSSPERDNGSRQRAGTREAKGPSVKEKLEAFRAARAAKKGPARTKQKSGPGKSI